MTSPFDLTGRTALVTGGNQGLGRAFAFGLAEAGARVAIVGRSADRNARVAAEAADAGHDFVTITADITDGAQVTRMTEVPPTAIELVAAPWTPPALRTEDSAASTAPASGEANWTVKVETLAAAIGLALGVAPGTGVVAAAAAASGGRSLTAAACSACKAE